MAPTTQIFSKSMISFMTGGILNFTLTFPNYHLIILLLKETCINWIDTWNKISKKKNSSWNGGFQNLKIPN